MGSGRYELIETPDPDVKSKHVSLVGYAHPVLHRRPYHHEERFLPVVKRYASFYEELSDRLRMRGLGMAVVYRGTAKPKAAAPA